MKERIKELRKALGYVNQQSFADSLGLSINNLSSYESGRRNPSDAVIRLICEKFGVSEEWLRTGTGEMFTSQVDDVQITNLLADVLTHEEDDFKRRLISALARLDSEGWKRLEVLIDDIAEKKKSPGK